MSEFVYADLTEEQKERRRESARRYHERHREARKSKVRETNKAYRAENMAKHLEQNAEWRKRNPEYSREYAHRPGRATKQLASTRLYKYNLTDDRYQEMLTEQCHQCAICGKQLDSHLKTSIPHIDHCHVTGTVRGLLCGNCNTGLGMLGDNAERLRSAASYLDRFMGRK